MRASFAFQRMDGSRTLDAELSRCQHLITQKETELTALKNGLPDKLPAITTLPQDSQLAHLLTELRQAEAELQAAPSSPFSRSGERFATTNFVTLFSARFDKLTGGWVKPLWAKIVIAAIVSLFLLLLCIGLFQVAPLVALVGGIVLAYYWKRLAKTTRWASLGGIVLLVVIWARMQHAEPTSSPAPVNQADSAATSELVLPIPYAKLDELETILKGKTQDEGRKLIGKPDSTKASEGLDFDYLDDTYDNGGHSFILSYRFSKGLRGNGEFAVMKGDTPNRDRAFDRHQKEKAANQMWKDMRDKAKEFDDKDKQDREDPYHL